MKRFDDINVIPLIDVMLVLLAVVLVTASFIVQDSLQIDLPKTDNTETYVPPKEKMTAFAIDAEGQLYVDEEPFEFSALKARLEGVKKTTPLTIKIDSKTEFGKVIQLVDILKGEALTNLTFLTDKSSGKTNSAMPTTKPNAALNATAQP